MRLVVILCCLSGAVWAGSPPQDYRKTLHAPAEIEGYPCAKGYAWFYADGHLERCSVSRDTAFGEAQVPAKSIVVLHPDGRPNYVFLSRATPIDGCKCTGGSWLGTGESDMTVFYPNGRLHICYLKEDQEVQGTPCMATGGFLGAVFHYGGEGVHFRSNGKLQSCTLSKDSGGLRRGQRIVLP